MRPIQRRGRALVPRRHASRGARHRAPHVLALAATLVALLSTRAVPAQSGAGRAAPAAADREAKDRITTIMATEFGKQRFDAAEGALLEVIDGCEQRCSAATRARAWMYVGIVQGSGKKDIKTARESFESALTLDRGVSLDVALASPETVGAFEAARQAVPDRGRAGPLIGAPSGVAVTPAPAPLPGPPRQALACTPNEREIQTRRPIPFDCHTDAETAHVTLRYREHSGARWQTLELEPTGSSFRATLPCSVTMNSGRLELFVVATDDAGDPVDTLGSKNEPITLVLNPMSNVAPAYPGEAAPDRCEEQVLCPPEFPGCEDPDAVAPRASRAAFHSKHRVSLHFAADLGRVGGSDVCTSSNTDYDCFISGTSTPFPGALPDGVAMIPGEVGEAYPGTEIDSGLALGTLRILLEYDHAVSERVSIAGRLGFAWGGAPTTLDGEGFLPLHLEAMLRYWPRGQWASGLRPYLHFGAGLAEADLDERELTVQDCTEEPNRAAFLDCIAAQGAYAPENDPALPERTVDAFRKLGDVFASAGGGLLVPLSERLSLQVDVNAMLLFPSVGVIVQPSFGVSYGL